MLASVLSSWGFQTETTLDKVTYAEDPDLESCMAQEY